MYPPRSTAVLALLASLAVACTDPEADPAAEIDAGTSAAERDEAIQLQMDLPRAMTLSEGASMTGHVWLATAPTAQVMVMATSARPDIVAVSPSSLSFDAGTAAAHPQVMLTAVPDADIDDGVVNVQFTTMSGTSLATVTVTVTDTTKLALSLSAPSLSLTEGSALPLAVRLSARPKVDVIVRITSDDPGAVIAEPATLTFRPQDWLSAQNVTVRGVPDLDSTNERAVLTFASPGVTPASAVVTVADRGGPAIELVPRVELDEGSATELDVRLNAPPPGLATLTLRSADPTAVAVTSAPLTFSPDDWSNYKRIRISAPYDLDKVSEVVTLTADLVGIAPPQTAVATVHDRAGTALVVTPVPLTLTAGTTSRLAIHLSDLPPQQVTVAVTSDTPQVAAVSTTALDFGSNFVADQWVTVTGATPAAVARATATLTVASTGLPSIAVPTTVVRHALIVDLPARTTLTEGATIVGHVRLATIPSGRVVVTVASDLPGVVPGAGSLSFDVGDWDHPHELRLTAVPDDNADGEVGTLTLGGNSTLPLTLVTAVTDTTPLAISVATPAVAVTEGASVPLTVRLNGHPRTPLAVAITSSDRDAVRTDPAVLNFEPNGATTATVSVVGVPDLDAANERVTLTFAGGDARPASATVSVTDRDVQAMIVTSPTVTLPENGTTSFGVHLAAQPLTDVIVTVTSLDLTAATVRTTALVFKVGDYRSDQPVVVAGVVRAGIESATAPIRLTAPGMADVTVTATVTDVAPPALTITRGPEPLCQGGRVAITIRLAAAPLALTTATVTVTGTGTVALSPAFVTFFPDDWAARTVTLEGAHAGAITIRVSRDGQLADTLGYQVLPWTSPQCL